MNILVTAGPTREPIDPVRFISNRSSGKMGYAVAAAAARRGHAVVLVTGPVAIPPPPAITLVRVETAAQMLDAVRAHMPDTQALIMAAAVADWRPRACAPQKLKKHASAPVLELERTEDVLKAIRPLKGDRLFIGFAAETERVVEEARRKLAEKGLDAIVANDVSRADAGFEVDTNRVTLITAAGEAQDWPLLPKSEVADRLIRWLESVR